jgi:hypothetical protein
MRNATKGRDAGRTRPKGRPPAVGRKSMPAKTTAGVANAPADGRARVYTPGKDGGTSVSGTLGTRGPPHPVECPRPIKVGEGKFARNFFRYGDVIAFIDGRAGDPPRTLSETDRVRLITAREFRHLLGDVSEMFLWRLLNKDRAAAA